MRASAQRRQEHEEAWLKDARTIPGAKRAWMPGLPYLDRGGMGEPLGRCWGNKAIFRCKGVRPRMVNCVVCNTPNTKRQPGAGNFARFDCPRCGAFVLSRAAEDDLPEYFAQAPIRRSLMSYTLRRMQRPGGAHLRTIEKEDLQTFWQMIRLPTPTEQADNLILWLGNSQTVQSEWFEEAQNVIAATVGLPITQSNDAGGFAWLNSQLEPKGLYQHQPGSQAGRVRLQLTMSGWERYEILKHSIVDSHTAFVAMKFGDATLNRVVEDCFKPAVARTGFELRKLNATADTLDGWFF